MPPFSYRVSREVCTVGARNGWTRYRQALDPIPTPRARVYPDRSPCEEGDRPTAATVRCRRVGAGHPALLPEGLYLLSIRDGGRFLGARGCRHSDALLSANQSVLPASMQEMVFRPC